MDKRDNLSWSRTADGNVILRLIEEWEAGLTEHGDLALCLTSTLGNDPEVPSGETYRSQFICTREDAKAIAHMILRTLAFSEAEQAPDFAAFRDKIRSPALRALADDWNAARGARRMPSWDDVIPDAAAPYLGYMWAYDYDRDNREFTGRMAGGTIMQNFGRSFLGTKLRDLHPPLAFEAVQAVLMRTLSEPACSRWSGALYRIGDTIVEGERLILPIGADPDHPDGVLGASHYDDFPLSHKHGQVTVLGDIAEWYRV
jgi:hypothetical protein